MNWRLQDIASILDAQWLGDRNAEASSTGVIGFSTDSRELSTGSVFVAISGSSFDGHSFVEQAITSGAVGAIIDQNRLHEMAQSLSLRARSRTLCVPDPVMALQTLAAAHRKTLTKALVIGVTGSNGKTTTCRLVHAALSAGRAGVRSRRSFNNHLGVPLTILSARSHHDFLICEIGANAPGEVDHLASILRPDVAVITSVGRAHVGGFGDEVTILREKVSLASRVQNGGRVYAADLPQELRESVRGVTQNSRFVGLSESADVRIDAVVHVPKGLQVTLSDGAVFEAPVVGAHNAANIAFAVSIAREAGLEDATIARGLANADLPPMRLQRRQIAGVDVLNDAYNANPDSMRAAIETFLELAPSSARTIAILGDMLELGSHSESAHDEIVQFALGDSRLDQLICVGPNMAAAARRAGLPAVQTTPSADDEAINQLARRLEPGDSVLLKGSRGMRLERIAEALHSRGGAMFADQYP